MKQVIRHRFTGEMLTTSQKWGAVETTPNHSIYGRDGKTFFPGEKHEVLAIRALPREGIATDEQKNETIDVVAGIEATAL